MNDKSITQLTPNPIRSNQVGSVGSSIVVNLEALNNSSILNMYNNIEHDAPEHIKEPISIDYDPHYKLKFRNTSYGEHISALGLYIMHGNHVNIEPLNCTNSNIK